MESAAPSGDRPAGAGLPRSPARCEEAVQCTVLCSVVIATRNRRDILCESVRHLRLTSPGSPIVVVDNASSDGTVAALRRSEHGVRVIPLERNAGAAARTVGAFACETPYVAFSDDDSWWAQGALARAVEVLEAYPSLALVNARVCVRDEAHPDPVSCTMAASPLRTQCDYPWPAIASFMAGAVVFRRTAYLGTGGYHPRFVIGAEEPLVALDLRHAGWELAYLPEILLYHAPADVARDPAERRRLVARNRLWTAWLRLPAATAATATLRLAYNSIHDPIARRALVEAIGGAHWIFGERRCVSRDVSRTFEAHVATVA